VGKTQTIAIAGIWGNLKPELVLEYGETPLVENTVLDCI